MQASIKWCCYLVPFVRNTTIHWAGEVGIETYTHFLWKIPNDDALLPAREKRLRERETEQKSAWGNDKASADSALVFSYRPGGNPEGEIDDYGARTD